MDHAGKLSGAIAQKFFEENNMEYVLYPYNYDMNLPIEEFNKNDTLYFLDVVCQPNSGMQLLIDSGYELIICDHHKSFLDTQIHKQVKGNCSLDYAGCELTWQYFYPNIQMPEFVRLLGRYDIWDKSDEWETKILPFQWGMRNIHSDPIIDSIWKDLFRDESLINSILHDGEIILKYQRKMYSGLMKTYSFSATLADFPDLRLICLNSPGGNSMMFEEKWDPLLYDAMFAFTCKGDSFVCSLYTSKDLDLSTIAKSYGGGGHAQACGFLVKKLNINNGIISFEGDTK